MLGDPALGMAEVDAAGLAKILLTTAPHGHGMVERLPVPGPAVLLSSAPAERGVVMLWMVADECGARSLCKILVSSWCVCGGEAFFGPRAHPLALAWRWEQGWC